MGRMGKSQRFSVEGKKRLFNKQQAKRYEATGLKIMLA